jgi:parvulin-like peptidyl-prolyl isomerase
MSLDHRRALGLLLCAALMTAWTVDVRSAGEPVVVARVGDQTITSADVEQLATYRKLRRSNPTGDRDQLKALLDELIVERLVTAEARGISLEGRLDITLRIRQAEIQKAAQSYGIDHILPQYYIDSITIDTFYQAHIGRYTAARDQRRVRHLTVFLPGKGVPQTMTTYVDSVYDGWDPQRKIDSLYTRLAAGEDFAVLARIHSEDPQTRGTGGDMGWISSQTLAPGEFAQHCFTQPLHYISRPFVSNIGWHIVQVTGARPAGPLPLDDEIRADIVPRLTEMQSKEIARRISDSLKAAGSLEFIESTIALPDDRLRSDMPLAVANRRDTIWVLQYLNDRLHWIEQNKGVPLGIDEKKNVIRSEYYKHLCWYNALRELGYLDRPEIRSIRAELLADERETMAQLQMTAAGYDPDEAAIEQYYQTHATEFGKPPAPLSEVRHTIRSRLKAERQEQVRREWIRQMTARHGVVRYDERLATISLPSS